MKPVRWLTLRTAARDCGRTRRTLMRWIKEGMPTGRDEKGRHIVREDVLMENLRARLRTNPAHQHRLRRAEAEAVGDTSDHPGLTSE